MANNDNQKQNKGPQHTLVLTIPSVNTTEKTVLVRAALLLGKDKVPGVGIAFEVNGDSQVGDFITNNEGLVEHRLRYHPDATKLTIKAVASVGNRASDTKSVNLEQVADSASTGTKTKGPAEIGLFVESNKVRDGDFIYYIALMDMKTGKTISGKITVMIKRPVRVNREVKSKPFELDITPDGIVIEIESDEVGNQEIDLIPHGFPKGHRQLEFYGPARLPVQAHAHSPWLVRFFNGCV
jgi:hypothetical protein